MGPLNVKWHTYIRNHSNAIVQHRFYGRYDDGIRMIYLWKWYNVDLCVERLTGYRHSAITTL